MTMIIKNCGIYLSGCQKINNGYIKIENKKFVDIGHMENAFFDGTEEFYDAQNLFAYPGLIDAHSHIGLFGNGAGAEGDDGNEQTDPITPHLRAVDGINPQDLCFSEALDWGVTTVVVGPGSANPISGQICAMKTYGACIDEMVITQNLAMKMSLGENPKETYLHRSQFPTTRMATAALIRDTLYRTKRYMQDLDRSKSDAEDSGDPPEYDAKLEALIPLLKRNASVHFHTHRADDIFTALRLAKEFSFDVVLVHATEAHLISENLDKNVKIICGPILGHRSKPELVSSTRKMPAILMKKGIMTALCTDHPELPQDCLMLSAAIAHKEGMPRDAAICSITAYAASVCGIFDRVGSIDLGKDADIVLYDEDPLNGYVRPKAVFCDGIKVR